MSRLAHVPKTSSFTDAISPDFRINLKLVAIENPDNVIHTPRILKSGGFSWTLPEPRKEYRYLTSSDTGLASLGLDPTQVSDETYQKIVSGEIYNGAKLSGDHIVAGGIDLPVPYAQAYAGWQFGLFAGQLGDGRVHNLFELPKTVQENNGVRNRNKYELQLKGSGFTPFSRFADGKAVLRSSIREYIISEHLHAIGIPSTRALALSYLPKTYAQRLAAEKCAVVARFAELWVRLGSFDLYRWRGDRAGIRELSDYVVKELFTIDGSKFEHLELALQLRDFFEASKNTIGELTHYDKMYLEIIVRNATTSAKCQAYGFLNGVLNTDNTSVLGLAMDFGPFSIMDKYDPNYTPNSEDHDSRYGYANTPTAIWWNLTRLGEDLAELIGAGELLDDPLFKHGVPKDHEDRIITRATKVIETGGDIYKHVFTKVYAETFLGRLGLPSSLVDPADPDAVNTGLIEPLLSVLFKVQCDFNKFFWQLQELSLDATELAAAIVPELDEKVSRYSHDELVGELDAWLSIYKTYLAKSNEPRRSISEKYNPLFLPRNWILDQVIQHTQDSNGEDLSYLHKVERMSFHPFDRSKWGDDLKELETLWLLQSDKGEEYAMLQCSCSS